MTASRAMRLLASYEFGLLSGCFAPPAGVDPAEWLEALTLALQAMAERVAAERMGIRLVPALDDDDGRAA